MNIGPVFERGYEETESIDENLVPVLGEEAVSFQLNLRVKVGHVAGCG